MLSLSSPLWLLALLALPLVWWLHRFREYGSRVPVAAQFLWSGGPQSGASGRLARRPQPIWLLRALLTGLLVLTLAGPHWRQAQAPLLTVWLDDSVSMFSREQDSTRMRQALSALQRALSAGGHGPVTLRSLGSPGQMLRLQGRDWSSQLAAFAARPRGEPQLPAPATMPADSLHWLVTDGASTAIASWAERAPLSRRLQVGASRDNVGVTGLALRRNGVDAAQLSIALRNGGERFVERRLMLHAGNELLGAWDLAVDAGGSLVQTLGLDDLPSAALQASLAPTDALPLDDRLTLPAAPLQSVGVRFVGRCKPHLRAALAAHPALVEVPVHSADVGLTVHCGPPPPDLQGPALVASDSSVFVPLTAEVLWHVGSGELRDIALRPDWFATPVDSVTEGSGAGMVLLSAGGRPLITHLPRRRLLLLDLDLGQRTLVRQPEYPLLVAALVQRLLGWEKTHGEIATVRSDAPVVIAPQSLPAGRQAGANRGAEAQRDLSVPLIIAALCLLLSDLLFLLRRQWSRGTGSHQAVAGG